MKATIILSGYDSKGHFLTTLYATCFQSTPPSTYQVIVVDNHWLTTEDVHGFTQLQKFFPHLHLLKNPSLNFSQLVNQAVRQAKGTYILYLESHCLPPYNWIESWLTYASQTGHKAAIGAITQFPTNNPTSHHEMKLIYISRKKVRDQHGGNYHASFHHGCIRRDYFLQKCLFDEELKQLGRHELGARLHHNGENTPLAKHITVSHANHVSITAYCKTMYDEGYDKSIIYAKNGENFMSSYFPMNKYPKYYTLIRAFRIPLLVGTTIMYHMIIGSYELALAFKQHRLSEHLFMLAVVYAHRRGQLCSLGKKRRETFSGVWV